jgi:hypothetical protein
MPLYNDSERKKGGTRGGGGRADCRVLHPYPLAELEHSGVTRPCSFHQVERITGQFVTLSG